MKAALAESADTGSGTIAERLTVAAIAILMQLGYDETRQAEAPGAGGRVSVAALDLLAVDALVTYAAEAAAEECQSFATSTDAMMARLATIRVNGEVSD